ncbi:hypothetical protein BDV59DRAFT_88523 [Aspergillus ambiguus]|uniref:uncharacterized protein n=1 Tax=Aspergillus ambiguus TaxID=176160 RepID=UPI003CCD051F
MSCAAQIFTDPLRYAALVRVGRCFPFAVPLFQVRDQLRPRLTLAIHHSQTFWDEPLDTWSDRPTDQSHYRICTSLLSTVCAENGDMAPVEAARSFALRKHILGPGGCSCSSSVPSLYWFGRLHCPGKISNPILSLAGRITQWRSLEEEKALMRKRRIPSWTSLLTCDLLGMEHFDFFLPSPFSLLRFTGNQILSGLGPVHRTPYGVEYFLISRIETIPKFQRHRGSRVARVDNGRRHALTSCGTP